MKKIGLIDYNAGNLRSVINAFRFLKCEIVLEKNPENLKQYDKLILPGVGAFGDVIDEIRNKGFEEPIKEFVKSGKYIFGICLGMQLLFEKSYEFGKHKGLGLIQGEIVKFNSNLRIPHIGWNKLIINDERKTDPLLNGITNEDYLYFVHSFHATCDEKYVLAFSKYGEKFPAIVNKDNIYGIQPHPEKSHNLGLKIIENFISL